MILYENSLSSFCDAVTQHQMIHFLTDQCQSRLGVAIQPLTRTMWKYMLEIISERVDIDRANPDCGIRIDLCLSTLRQRLVTILASRDQNGRERVLMLDLIPWEKVRMGEEDMVFCDEGDGEGEKTAIHPSYQSLSYRNYLRQDTRDMEFTSISYLFECSFSPETDIVSGYKPRLLQDVPVFYAGDRASLAKVLRPVLSGEDGIEVLRHLRQVGSGFWDDTIEQLTDDQKCLISALRESLRKKERAWFIVQTQSSASQSIVTGIVRREAERLGEKLTILSEEDNLILKKMPGDGVTLCFFGRYADSKLFERMEKIASARGIGFQRFYLHRNVGASDSGQGLDFLARYFQIEEKRVTQWNPLLFSIEIVDRAEDLPSREGYASVTVGREIGFDPEKKIVTGSREDKRKLFRQLGKGRQGVTLYLEDEELRAYLKRKVEGAKNRYQWIQSFQGNFGVNDGRLGEALSGVLANEKLHAKKERELIDRIGQSAWDKMQPDSRMWLISGILAYNDMKNYDQLLDFSGVCIQICKAVENELAQRYFVRYQDYLREKYGEDAVRLAPKTILTAPRDDREQTFLAPEAFTLGGVRFLMGQNEQGTVVDIGAWESFLQYAREVLFLNPGSVEEELKSHLKYIDRIRSRYRNHAAHNVRMDAVKAGECIDYIVGSQRRIGIMLDAYRF